MRKTVILTVGFLSCALVQAQTLIFPQIADGGGIRFELSLTNPRSVGDEGDIAFFTPDGRPLPLAVGGGLKSTVPYSVPPGGSFSITSQGTGDFRNGYAVVHSSNVAFRLSGNLTFEIAGAEVSVPNIEPSREFHTSAEKTSERNSGIALVNANNNPIDISATLRSQTGSILAETTVHLQAGQQQAAFLDELFNTSENISGSIHLRSEDEFSMLSLRQRTDGALATLSNAPIAFPGLRFAVAPTEKDEMGVIAVHENGEKLIALTETNSAGGITGVSGAVWIGLGGQHLTMRFGFDGLPERVIFGEFIFLFENYTEDTVDIAVIDPAGDIEVAREVPIDANDISTLRDLADDFLGVSPRGGFLSTVFKAAKVVGLGVSVVTCGVLAFKTGGAALLKLGPPCKSAATHLAFELSEFVFDETPAQVTSASVAVFGCAKGIAQADAIETTSNCLNTLGSLGLLALKDDEDEEQEKSGLIDAAEDQLNDVEGRLVSWWPAEGNANDQQGDNDGQFVGSVGFTTGKAGLGFQLDGSRGSGVLIGDASNLEANAELTIEAWVKTSDTSRDRPIISKHLESSPRPSWILRTYFTEDSGRVSFGVNTDQDTSVTAGEIHSTSSIADGRFHHIVGRYDGSTLQLFIDGNLEATRSLQGTVTDSPYAVVIGGFGNADGTVSNHRSFNGVIDEVKFYDRALSETELQERSRRR